jgi:hypothetical protein
VRVRLTSKNMLSVLWMSNRLLISLAYSIHITLFFLISFSECLDAKQKVGSVDNIGYWSAVIILLHCCQFWISSGTEIFVLDGKERVSCFWCGVLLLLVLDGMMFAIL